MAINIVLSKLLCYRNWVISAVLVVLLPSFLCALLSNVLRDRNRYLYWLPWTPCSSSDNRGSVVAYIFYTLWQYLEFIEGQLGPVRNVVTLDCLPGLQTTDKPQHKTPGW